MEQTAPAFQFYASDTMADKRYRLMTLAERGLLISLLCECWVNRSVPADPEQLGKWLGYQSGEIRVALSSGVLSFFSASNGELSCPKLEQYRNKLEESRRKMSAGGRKGAEGKWGKPPSGDSHPIAHPNGGSMGARVERSRVEKSRTESLEKGVTLDSFVADYEAAENCTAEQYANASGG